MRPHLASLTPVLLLGVLFACLPPDGKEGSPWLHFFGKFHLLTIHFPIALLYLVPVLEVAGRYERFHHLRTAVEFVLVLAMIASLLAALLGWSLAHSGGYSGRIVTQHMWGGLFTAFGCWLCWLLRARANNGSSATYVAGLALSLAVVSWTGYRGGQLTQGENHLTAGVRELFGLVPATRPSAIASAPIDRSTFYGARVEPILAKNCYSCHGADKRRGGLRLDSYAALMRGGKDGAEIRPGNAQASELVRRIKLPQTDDDAMPPQGKHPLSSSDVETIVAWINSGASESAALSAVQGAPVVAPTH